MDDATKLKGRNSHHSCFLRRGKEERQNPKGKIARRAASKRYYEKNKEALLERNKLWKKENLERSNANVAAWREANKEKLRAMRAARNISHREEIWASKIKKYGITAEIYREMFRKQSGVCAICGNPEPKKKLHVDHEHRDGRIRGLLCSKCNLGIGLFSDDIRILRKAVSYLSKANRFPST